MPRTDLRLASRALRAASRAAAASITFWMISPGVGGILLEPFGELVGHQAFERLADLGADQFVLGLARELGVGQLDRDDRGQAFAHVFAGQADLLALQDSGLVAIIVDRAGERGAEGGEVGAAVALGDVVGEGEDVLVIGIIPFERDLDADIVALPGDRDRVGDQRSLGAVEIFDEGRDPALVVKLDLLGLVVAGIGEDDAHAGVEEGELAEAVLEPLEIEIDDLEGRGAGQEGDPGALFPLDLADDLERGHRITVGEAHVMFFAVAPDGEVEPFRERVDDADADAVEAARDLVGILVIGVVELTPGVELGHDDLGRRDAFAFVDSGRDAAAIVLDADRAVGVQRDEDAVAMAGQRLVDGIVRNLEHHVVEARAVIGVADVHAGPLAHRVEALEDLDALGAIIIAVGGVLFGVGCHSPDIGIYAPEVTRVRVCVRARTRESGRLSRSVTLLP